MNKKSGRIEIRLPEETKVKTQQLAAESNRSTSELIRALIEEEYNQLHSCNYDTHEKKTSFYLIFNKLENIISSHTDLPINLKKELIQEINSYIINQN